jgi:predicted nucleotidyltransferase
LLTERLDFFPPYDETIDRSWLNLVVIVLVFGWIAFHFPSAQKVQAGLEEGYPAKSVAYLKEHNIRDGVLAAYLWGGYLERNYREMPVFIDSRVDIFEYNGTLKDYLDITSMKNSLALLDKYKINYVYFPPNEPLSYLLRNNVNWEPVYEDKVSVLIKRRIPLAAK